MLVSKTLACFQEGIRAASLRDSERYLRISCGQGMLDALESGKQELLRSLAQLGTGLLPQLATRNDSAAFDSGCCAIKHKHRPHAVEEQPVHATVSKRAEVKEA